MILAWYPPLLEAQPFACWEDAKASEVSISLNLGGFFTGITSTGSMFVPVQIPRS